MLAWGSSKISQVYLSLGRWQGRYWRTRVIGKALSPLSWNEQPLYNFLCIFCVCCLCFCNGGYVPQFFVCSSNASLYRCMAECRWLLKEKASRAPIKTIPLVFRSRNFGKVLVGITLMTQWQSHSWELAIWYPSFICCNRAHFFAFKLSGNAYRLQFLAFNDDIYHCMDRIWSDMQIMLQ